MITEFGNAAAWRRTPSVSSQRCHGNLMKAPKLPESCAQAELYRPGRVTVLAAWVHERDEPMVAGLERRGYTLDTANRAMGMALDEIAVPRPQINQGPA